MSLPKLHDLSQLFVLGASSSDVGWRYPDSPLPTKDRPMGVEDPCGPVHWCSPDDWQKNWVQHISSDCQAKGQDLRIYDFAVGGSMTRDGLGQTKLLAALLNGDGDRCVELDVGKSTCVVYFGGNDVCLNRGDVVEQGMMALKSILDECYTAGVRNIILVDVTPRRPSIRAAYTRLMDRVEEWNKALPAVLEGWLKRQGTTGEIFPANRLYADILRNPFNYGFGLNDPYVEPAGIWADHIHTTSKVQRIVADAFTRELQ